MFKKIKSWFLTIFGCIKVFKYPLWIVYDPVLYQLSGEKLRKIMNTLKPGDIVLRGYVHYLDGWFIPGDFTHSGIYIGNGRVIHSVAKGVCEVDVLDFYQADRAAICRIKGNVDPKLAEEAIQRAKMLVGTPYDYQFSEGDEAMYCHEMTRKCYPSLDIRRQQATALWGLLKKKDPVYLAQSIFDCPSLDLVLKIDTEKK